MNRIVNYIDNCFCAIPSTTEVQNMKANIYEHMMDSFQNLIQQGKNEDEAFGIVVSEFGSMEEILKELNIESPNDVNNTGFQKEYMVFQKQAAIAISIGVGLLIFGVITIAALESLFSESSDIPQIVGMMFFLVSIVIFVYYGISTSRYEQLLKKEKGDKLSYSKKETKEHAKKGSKLGDRISGIIMLSATGIFFIMGVFFNAWHPGWAVFPIGGIICGIISECFG